MDVYRTRCANLRLLIAEHDHSQTRLAQRLGKSPSQISQWLGGYRQISEASAREIETLTRKAPLWLDALHAAEPAGALDETSPAEPRGHASTGMAQVLSLPIETVAPTIEWERLMKPHRLPSQFYIVLPDDAMAPRAPRGTRVLLDSRRAAAPGDAVLLRDAAGNCWVREWRALLGGRWQAHASNPAYPSLHSENGDLTVLAVLVGIQATWSELAR